MLKKIVLLFVMFICFGGMWQLFKEGEAKSKMPSIVLLFIVAMVALYFSGVLPAFNESTPVAKENNEANVASSNSQNTVTGKPYEVITSFMKNNPKYGEFYFTVELEPWAKGKKYKVHSKEDDKYIFYLHNDEVVGVWGDENGNFTKLYNKDIPDLPENVTREATANLPEYTILDQMDMVSGGKHADILIKSLSPSDPFEKRKVIFKEIIDKENLKEASFYCTEEAKKANLSESYSEENPNAMDEGYLGMYYDGEFYE